MTTATENLSTPATGQNPESVVPRIERRPEIFGVRKRFRVVTDNGDFDRSPRFKYFRTMEAALARFDREQAKAEVRRAKNAWKVVTY